MSFLRRRLDGYVRASPSSTATTSTTVPCHENKIHTPRKTNGTWKWTPGRGDSYWKPSFSGSMLVFGGVLFLEAILYHLEEEKRVPIDPDKKLRRCSDRLSYFSSGFTDAFCYTMINSRVVAFHHISSFLLQQNQTSGRIFSLKGRRSTSSEEAKDAALWPPILFQSDIGWFCWLAFASPWPNCCLNRATSR